MSIESPPLPLSISCAPVESGSLACGSTRRRPQSRRAASRRLWTDAKKGATSTFSGISSQKSAREAPTEDWRESERAGSGYPRITLSAREPRNSPGCQQASRQGNDLNTQPGDGVPTFGDTTTTTTAAAVDLNFFPQ